MVFINFHILVLRTKVASALEGLKSTCDGVENALLCCDFGGIMMMIMMAMVTGGDSYLV